MSQIASANLSQAIAEKLSKILHLVGSPRLFLHTPKATKRRDQQELSAGGYNEAFVMQQWASYSPRH